MCQDLAEPDACIDGGDFQSVVRANGTENRATICLGHGPRQTERALVADVNRLLGELGSQALQRPILIVVPSNSLRLHLLSQLAREGGKAIAGLSCTTLHGLARHLVLRAGGLPPTGVDPFPLFARRFAREESSLQGSLDGLVDGYASILGSVRDLLDAGLEPAHEEALLEVLETEGREAGSPAEVERVKSLVRVATRTAQTLEDRGLGRHSTLLAEATALLKNPRASEQAPGALLVYGFADATGLATDFLMALLERYAGRIYLDRPPDPTSPEQPDPGIAFARRFEERIRLSARVSDRPLESLEPTVVEMRRAPGAEAEARAVAQQIRQLIDGGVRPEAIGVVARAMGPYSSPLGTHFSRLGVPFSGVGLPGPLSAEGRRVRALLDLLLLGARAPLERWLDAREVDSLGAADFDIRLALFALGLGRLEEARDFDLDRLPDGEDFPLPVRQGFAEEDEPETARNAGSTPRRKIRASVLRAAIESARLVAEQLESGTITAPLGKHREGFEDLLFRGLEWSAADPLSHRLVERLEGRLAPLPLDLRLDGSELALLLEESLQDLARTAFGGDGGGVQVMEVTQSRGRTFEHLFLLGLNRGDFPRTVREDPIFPDTLRQLLGAEGHGVLPDLPVKRSGYDEERFLFAQLLASAPRVCLSWQGTDDDNKTRTPSPLVERLRWSQRGQQLAAWSSPPRLPHLYSPPPPEKEPLQTTYLRPAVESAVLVALHGSRPELAGVMPAAIAEAESEWGRADPLSSPEALAAARLRVLAELDPERGLDEGERIYHSLGPYFGFVGAAMSNRDPRRAGDLYITTLEAMVRCPWQTFLERVLRLEPLPDPLAALPSIEARYVGSLVHGVAERIVLGQLPSPPPSLDEIQESAAQAIVWPEGDALRRQVEAEAEWLVRKEGIALPGYAHILAEIALPHLEVLRRTELAEECEARTLAAEIEGRYELEMADGEPRPLSFRADRVDLLPDQLILTDYKTGRAASKKYLTSVQEDTREKHFLAALSEGNLLQAPLYALATRARDGRGRFLFLDPEFGHPTERRTLTVGGDDRAALAAFEQTARTAVVAWEHGAFFPRLQLPDKDAEPSACEHCLLAEACLRGDSGARGRLAQWADAHEDQRAESRGPTDAAEALLDLWLLPAKKKRGRS